MESEEWALPEWMTEKEREAVAKWVNTAPQMQDIYGPRWGPCARQPFYGMGREVFDDVYFVATVHPNGRVQING